MRASVWIAIAVAIAVLIGAWYYYAHMQPRMPAAASTSSAGTSTPPVQGDGTGVSQNLILGQSSSQSLGTYLTAYNGMTVYAYTPDAKTPGKSACNGGCAAVWPPYTVVSPGDIHVPATLSGTVSTITRQDGSLQITYNGKPLYFYSGDSQPNDTTGQGVAGVWFVLKP